MDIQNEQGPDFSYILELADGDEQFISELLGIFFRETPQEKGILLTHMANEDAKQCASLVHKLISKLRIAGMSSFIEEASQLEHSLKNNGYESNHSNLEAFIDKLDACVEQVKVGIKTHNINFDI